MKPEQLVALTSVVKQTAKVLNIQLWGVGELHKITIFLKNLKQLISLNNITTLKHFIFFEQNFTLNPKESISFFLFVQMTNQHKTKN